MNHRPRSPASAIVVAANAVTATVVTAAALLLVLRPARAAAEDMLNLPPLTKTIVFDQTAKKRLLGRHALTLQWIGRRRYGSAKVIEREKVLHLEGAQRNPQTGDFLTINGDIEELDARKFIFRGSIVLQVSFNNGGKPCPRAGRMTFELKPRLRAWRLLEAASPCEAQIDNIDLFMR